MQRQNRRSSGRPSKRIKTAFARRPRFLAGGHSFRVDSAYYFFVVVVVIRHETTAAARGALPLIVRTFFNDAITVAVWTGFHLRLPVDTSASLTAKANIMHRAGIASFLIPVELRSGLRLNFVSAGVAIAAPSALAAQRTPKCSSPARRHAAHLAVSRRG